MAYETEQERKDVFDALDRAWKSLSFPDGPLAGKQTSVDFLYENNSPETIALLEKHAGLQRRPTD